MQNSKIGNLLNGVKQGIIVQQVNAQGVMGSGFAKAVREKWPKVFDAYKEHMSRPSSMADNGLQTLGQVIYVEVEPKLIIANLVGQQFYGRDMKRYTSYDALDVGFQNIRNFAILFEHDVHYPLIGCGLGGGDWTTVSAIIDHHLDTINHTLWVAPEMAHMIATEIPPQ